MRQSERSDAGLMIVLEVFVFLTKLAGVKRRSLGTWSAEEKVRPPPDPVLPRTDHSALPRAL